MLSIISDVFYLVKQRFVVLIIALFFAIVLFNTTFLNLGTYLPLVIIFLGFVCFSFTKKTYVNKKNVYFIAFAILLFFSTFISGGDLYRECLKILLTVCFIYKASKVKLTDSEIQYLSLFICISYLIYAVLTIQAIGQDTQYYGRAQLRILNSEIPLDPNVVAAVFVLPMVISLYNLLYGRYKLIAAFLLVIFLIAIIALGSRGATVSFVVPCVLLLLRYFLSRSTSAWIKLFSAVVIFVVAFFVIDFISEQDAIFGFDRIFDLTGDDASNGRTGVWLERLELITSSPLWGYGVNYDVGGTHTGMASHNTFIQVLHYGGLLDLFLFFIPVVSMYRRTTISKMNKIVLFLSVFMPVFFIDTLQERTLWNFLLFYSLLSSSSNANELLLWNIGKK